MEKVCRSQKACNHYPKGHMLSSCGQPKKLCYCSTKSFSTNIIMCMSFERVNHELEAQNA